MKMMKRFAAALLSAIMAVTMCTMTVFAEGGLKTAAERMIWTVESKTVRPGSDIELAVTITNPVALSEVDNVRLKASSPLTFTGMSDYCDLYHGNISYTNSGQVLEFSIKGSSPSAGSNGDTLFKVYLHVPDSCAEGKYYVTWDSSDWYALDASSSLETDGKKDVSKMKLFVEAVRKCN